MKQYQLRKDRETFIREIVEVAVPQSGAREVLVRVRAGSPNYRDYLRASAGVMGDGARGIAPFSDVERSARLNYSGRD